MLKINNQEGYIRVYHTNPNPTVIICNALLKSVIPVELEKGEPLVNDSNDNIFTTGSRVIIRHKSRKQRDVDSNWFHLSWIGWEWRLDMEIKEHPLLVSRNCGWFCEQLTLLCWGKWRKGKFNDFQSKIKIMEIKYIRQRKHNIKRTWKTTP